jgi:hypothetical protein
MAIAHFYDEIGSLCGVPGPGLSAVATDRKCVVCLDLLETAGPRHVPTETADVVCSWGQEVLCIGAVRQEVIFQYDQYYELVLRAEDGPDKYLWRATFSRGVSDYEAAFWRFGALMEVEVDLHRVVSARLISPRQRIAAFRRGCPVWVYQWSRELQAIVLDHHGHKLQVGYHAPDGAYRIVSARYSQVELALPDPLPLPQRAERQSVRGWAST